MKPPEQSTKVLEVASGRAAASTDSDLTPRIPALRIPEPESPFVLSEGTRVGRYLILRELGAGGMGVVYEAFDPELDRRVALKFIRDSQFVDPIARARQLREAQAMAKLAHPHVVSVFDVGIDDGRFFIAMEYVKGRTMRQWLRAAPRTWREVVDVLIAAGEGLTAAHHVGLIHRDFKPENVLIGDDGRVRVMDFGLARGHGPQVDSKDESTVSTPVTEAGRFPVASEPSSSSAAARSSSSRPRQSTFELDLTSVGEVPGTPGYLAPEQFQGSPAGFLTDQFAFGVALFKALFDERPFDISAEARRSKQPWKLRQPAGWTRVPTWLRKVLLKTLSIDPSERFPSMDAVVRQLRSDPRIRQRRMAIGVGVAVAALSIGGAAVTTQRWRTHECDEAGASLTRIWQGPERAGAKHAFETTDKTYAAFQWTTVERELDSFVSRWSRVRVDTCLAVRVRGEQSEVAVAPRLACLEHRREEMLALLELFQRADGALVQKSVAAVAQLGSPTACADLQVQAGDARYSAEQLRAGEELRSKLAPVKAFAYAAQYDKAAALTTELVASARKLGVAKILAEVLNLHAETLGRLNQDAAPAFREALGLSLQEQDERLESQIASQGLRYFSELVVLPAMEDWLAIGEVVSQRLRPDDPALGLWLTQAGMSLKRAQRLPESVKYQEAAVHFYEEHHLTGLPYSSALSNLAGLYTDQGRPKEAVLLHDQAIAISMELFGPDHPNTAYLVGNRAYAADRMGDFSLETQLQRRTFEILSKNFPKTHLYWGMASRNVGLAEMHAGRLTEAAHFFSQASACIEPALGSDNPELGIFYAEVGSLHSLEGDPAQALLIQQKALAILQKSFSSDVPGLAFALSGLGEAELALKRVRAASSHLTQAVQLLDTYPASEAATALRGWTHFLLAKALTESGGDPARIGVLLETAKAGLATQWIPRRKTIEAWLATH